MKFKKIPTFFISFLGLVCLLNTVVCSEKTTYDIVIFNGRIMDPFTRTDVMANMGIQEGKIAVIVPVDQMLSGDSVIDASGLVVAPGFINIHGHEGIIDKTMEVSVRDGVTTIIGGNCGGGSVTEEGEVVNLAEYFDQLEQKGMYSNYATFAGQQSLRRAVGLPDLHTKATSAQIEKIVKLLEEDLKAGSLGISFGPFYNRDMTYEEMLASAKKSADYGGGSSIHVRYAAPVRPNPSDEPLNIQAIREGIQLGKDADLPLIISHNGGPNLGQVNAGMALQVIYAAMEEGAKLISDVHPYDAFATLISAPVWEVFPLDMQLDWVGVTISDISIGSTITLDGKTFMEALEPFSSIDQFYYVRGKVVAGEIPEPGIIGHFYPGHMTLTWMQAPFVMIENDGFVDRDPKTGQFIAHPRIAGSFAKFLGYWVREKGVCDLMTGLSKASTMAAVWLGLDNKGRINVGADADIVIFDPLTIIDKATYEPEGCLNPPEGLPHVIVNGVLVVKDGELTGQKTGETIRRTWKVPGILVNHGILPGNRIQDLN